MEILFCPECLGEVVPQVVCSACRETGLDLATVAVWDAERRLATHGEPSCPFCDGRFWRHYLGTQFKKQTPHDVPYPRVETCGCSMSIDAQPVTSSAEWNSVSPFARAAPALYLPKSVQVRARLAKALHTLNCGCVLPFTNAFLTAGAAL